MSSVCVTFVCFGCKYRCLGAIFQIIVGIFNPKIVFVTNCRIISKIDSDFVIVQSVEYIRFAFEVCFLMRIFVFFPNYM